MFRRVYKNANRYIDSEEALQRVKNRLENEKKPSNKWQAFSAIAACFVMVVAGMSAYQFKKSDTIEENLIAPANELVKTARAGEPLSDTADLSNIEAMSYDVSVTEEKEEKFQEVVNDGSYEKRVENGIDIYEKTQENLYECWIEKDSRIIKITAFDINEEEKETVIKSILQ